MRNLFIAICMSLSLMGCAKGDFLVHNLATLETPQQKIQGTIDQTNAVITAVAKSVYTGWQEGVYTKEEVAVIREKLYEAKFYADQAQEILNLGDYSGSKAKLQLADYVISYIKKELIKAKE